MPSAITGIHHVTAIAGDPQRNVDFYVGLLGLRLVKRTINFDDPGTYHLYYGDGLGSPGTILTFFPWPRARQGQIGTGQTTECALAIPAGSLEFWKERLSAQGVAFKELPERLGDPRVLTLADPDGMQIALIETDDDSRAGWTQGTVPAECAVRGVHSVSLTLDGYENTARLLIETMGFREVRSGGDRFRFETGAGGSGATVDLICHPYGQAGRVAVGTIHHIAWRTPDDAQQQEWRKKLAALRFNVSPVLDRNYFHSIYFREPGGILFEIATDPPGFTVDESLEELGAHLKLPVWLEASREEIEAALPPLTLPKGGDA
jgi:glyoxalase family protein